MSAGPVTFGRSGRVAQRECSPARMAFWRRPSGGASSGERVTSSRAVATLVASFGEGVWHGPHEPARRVVPAHRGRGQPHAHRLGRGLRGSATDVRGVRGDGCREAAGRAALPPEGAIRSVPARPTGVGRRSALQPRRITCDTRRLRVPGGDRELRNLVGRVMSQQLDRHKPLWEMWMVEGLEHGHWALVSKVHHCMVDGVSGTDLLTVVLDAEREPASPLPDAWRPEAEPGSARLVVRRAHRPRRQPVRAVASGAVRDAGAAASARSARRARPRTARVGRRRSADADVVAQRSDRPAPTVGLGAHDARRREDGAQCARRHSERRRAHRAHAGLSRLAPGARRRRERSRRPHARAGIGSDTG